MSKKKDAKAARERRIATAWDDSEPPYPFAQLTSQWQNRLKLLAVAHTLSSRGNARDTWRACINVAIPDDWEATITEFWGRL